VASLTGLALISGLAAACFARALGIAFLGAPRSIHVDRARDPGAAMQFAQAALAVTCVLIGLTAPWCARALLPAVDVLVGAPGGAPSVLDTAGLGHISWMFAAVFAVAGLLTLLRKKLLAHRTVAEAGTWDC